ncbi:MAG: RNA 3'-terminal phosphate cyclase, partial [Nanoarchaeota archaeon]|nr:RNA 3'-terminal phosphate cyclase [Nanoarchaeota archaeon]
TTPSLKLLKQGDLEQIRGMVNASSDLEQKEVGERISKAAETKLKKYAVPITIQVHYAKSLSTGGEIVLWTVFSNNGEIDDYNPIIIGADALVEKNKTSEEIGQEAAAVLLQEIDSGMVVDKHLADQLIIFMGLLPGSTIIAKEVTDHLHTNIYVVEKFLPLKFKVEGEKISVNAI